MKAHRMLSACRPRMASIIIKTRLSAICSAISGPIPAAVFMLSSMSAMRYLQPSWQAGSGRVRSRCTQKTGRVVNIFLRAYAIKDQQWPDHRPCGHSYGHHRTPAGTGGAAGKQKFSERNPAACPGRRVGNMISEQASIFLVRRAVPVAGLCSRRGHAVF